MPRWFCLSGTMPTAGCVLWLAASVPQNMRGAGTNKAAGFVSGQAAKDGKLREMV